VLTTKALWIIERNLDRELGLPDLARACDVSRFHLAHAFGEATGMAVMEYVRGRRLTRAAHALAAGAGDILGVALDSGYGSHEAFTRAFRAQFDRTPEDVRNAGSLAGLALVAAILPQDDRPPQIPPPRFESKGELRFVGLGAPYDYGSVAHIPAQWQRFMAEFYGRIENRSEPIPVGVSTRDEAGRLLYVCAVEVSRFGAVPEPLIKLSLSPSAYAVFEHPGHASELHRTYTAIWNDWFDFTDRLPAEAPGYERHKPSFDPRTGEGGVSVWIAVEP